MKTLHILDSFLLVGNCENRYSFFFLTFSCYGGLTTEINFHSIQAIILKY